MLWFSVIASALAPGLALLTYFYLKDRYEQEPLIMVIKVFLLGFLIVVPVMIIQRGMTSGFGGNPYVESFIISSFVEEFLKWFVLYHMIYNHTEFDEPYDGIVYSVFIALGFAGLENVLYVLHPELGGLGTALIRAVLSVPAHGLFAVTTGYYFAMAKFHPSRRSLFLLKAFAVTWFLHGAYDFLLMAQMPIFLVLFVPLMAYMWHNGLRQIKAHLEASPFKISA